MICRHRLEQDAAEVQLLLDETHAMLAPADDAQTDRGAMDFQQGLGRILMVQNTLRELMGHIQSGLAEKPALSREEALVRIQRMWKLRKARKQLKALVREVYASFVDPDTGRTYYYNAKTNTAQWTKPKALGSEDLSPHVPLVAEPPVARRRATDMPFASREEREELAARAIQAMARTHAARRQLRRLISSVYEKIWDAETERFYYHNTKTREVKWVKPRWVSDDDLLTPRSRHQHVDALDTLSAGKSMVGVHKTQRGHTLTDSEAASMLQRLYRRRAGFRRLLELCRGVYERILDPEQQTYYYHNTRTKETSWDKPLLLRGAQAEVYTPRTRRKQLRPPATTSRELRLTQEQAILRLQGLFRARRARRALAAVVEQRYKKAKDAQTGRFYYVDLQTLATSWEPPALVRRSNAELSEF